MVSVLITILPAGVTIDRIRTVRQLQRLLLACILFSLAFAAPFGHMGRHLEDIEFSQRPPRWYVPSLFSHKVGVRRRRKSRVNSDTNTMVTSVLKTWKVSGNTHVIQHSCEDATSQRVHKHVMSVRKDDLFQCVLTCAGKGNHQHCNSINQHLVHDLERCCQNFCGGVMQRLRSSQPVNDNTSIHTECSSPSFSLRQRVKRNRHPSYSGPPLFINSLLMRMHDRSSRQLSSLDGTEISVLNWSGTKRSRFHRERKGTRDSEILGSAKLEVDGNLTNVSYYTETGKLLTHGGCYQDRTCAVQVYYSTTRVARQQAFEGNKVSTSWNCQFEGNDHPSVCKRGDFFFLRMPNFTKFEKEFQD